MKNKQSLYFTRFTKLVSHIELITAYLSANNKKNKTKTKHTTKQSNKKKIVKFKKAK